MKVKAALLFHRNVSAMTEVDTKDKIVTLVETNKGMVTLEGTVRNASADPDHPAALRPDIRRLRTGSENHARKMATKSVGKVKIKKHHTQGGSL